MISTRPYLLRAIYQWAMDNNLTPQLLVNASYPGVIIPQGHASDGRIVLNVQARAVKGLVMENDHVSFSARFSGQSHHIELPINAIEAIYTRETEKGMFFQPEPDATEVTQTDDTDVAGPQPALKKTSSSESSDEKHRQSDASKDKKKDIQSNGSHLKLIK